MTTLTPCSRQTRKWSYIGLEIARDGHDRDVGAGADAITAARIVAHGDAQLEAEPGDLAQVPPDLRRAAATAPTSSAPFSTSSLVMIDPIAPTP